jgi:hypothetical protein
MIRIAISAAVLMAGVSAMAVEPAATEPQGAPIGGAPIGAPIGGAPADASAPAGDPALGQPTRVIPQSSWDMLNTFEGGVDKPFEPSHDGVHLKVPFGALAAYEYEVADPVKLREAKDPKSVLGDQIPAKIKALDGQPILLVGFMVPIDVDRRGNVTSFALTQNQSFCCYGIPPGLTELVIVEMEEGKVAPYSYDVPVAAYGTMKVGEDIDDGYILSIYQMTSHEVVDVRELMRRAEKAKAAAPSAKE